MNWTNFGLLNIVAVGFLMIFIAFNSAANLAGLLMEKAGFQDLGTTNLAIIYLFVSICSLFSTGIVNKIGIKKALFISSQLYFLQLASNILPALYNENKDSTLFLFNRTFIIVITVTAAALEGIGAGLIWVSQGKYVSDCACEENKGFYFSYFWFIFMQS